MHFHETSGTSPEVIQPPETCLTLRLFGAFEIEQAGLPLPRTRTRKEQWLLALLVLHHHKSLERDWLAATLWLDSSEAQALDNLRRSLYGLRHVLGEDAFRIFSPTPRTLSIDLSGATCDLVAFDSAIAQASEAHSQDVSFLEKAVALYRGPLLEGCKEEWVILERAAREQAYLTALERLAAHAVESENASEAIRYLRLVVAADPFRESAQRALMEALAAHGDMAAATLVYRQLRLKLHEELRTEPAPETTALYQGLRTAARIRPTRRKEGNPPPPSLLHIPRPVSGLVGRVREVSEVASRLESARLVTLTGSGGIGKTRLTIAVAERVSVEFPDGVWFVDLASLSDGAFVSQAVAARLGVREEPGRPLTETLAGFLAAKSLLLILDNCEHLLRPCAWFADALLQACPNLRILATSRQTLNLTEESAWRVPSLGLPAVDPSQVTSPQQILQADAVRLFVERAMDASAVFLLTDRNANPVVQVCRRLDGIPLALELAAARVKVLSVEQIAARLDDRFRLLTGGSPSALPRHQTLRACIDWSYDLLSASEKALLRRLSVFAGGWTLEAAETVCTGKGVEPDAILDLLSELVDKSMIVFEGVEGEARYRLLETIRQYAEGRLLKCGEAAEVRQRHLEYCLRLAEFAEPQLTGPEQGLWLERLEAEHDNLRAALAFCSTELQASATPPSSLLPPPSEAGLRLAGALARFWYVRGHQEEGRRSLAEVLERSDQGPTAARAKALNGAGLLARNQGDHAAARVCHEESLNLYRVLEDEAGKARALAYLGITLHEHGENRAALPFMEESLGIMRTLDDKGGTAAVLGFLGLMRIRQEEFAAGRTLCEEALTLYRALGDKKGIALVLSHLAEVARLQSDYRAARALGQEALALLRPLGDRPGISAALNDLALAAWEQGDFAEARALHEESLAIQREMGDKTGIAWTLVRLGQLALNQNEFAAARASHEESLNVCRSLGDRPGIATTLLGLGFVAAKEGDYAMARQLFAESLVIARDMGDRRGIADALNGLGLAASRRGDREAAHALFEEALTIKRDALDPLGASLSLCELGVLAIVCRDFAQAHSRLVESLRLRQERGNKPGIAESLEALAALLAARASSNGDTPQCERERAVRLLGATEALREAIGYARSLQDQRGHDALMNTLRQPLGDDLFTAAYKAGRAMTLEEAIEYALRE